MRRSEVLEKASVLLGRPVDLHYLLYAQRIGAVDRAPIVGGWQRFEDKHATQLVTYMREHSRGPRTVSAQ